MSISTGARLKSSNILRWQKRTSIRLQWSRSLGWFGSDDSSTTVKLEVMQRHSRHHDTTATLQGILEDLRATTHATLAHQHRHRTMKKRNERHNNTKRWKHGSSPTTKICQQTLCPCQGENPCPSQLCLPNPETNLVRRHHQLVCLAAKGLDLVVRVRIRSFSAYIRLRNPLKNQRML